ncbi:MAG: biotin/lipoyl-containing protein [Caldilineaceae bacterium]
MAVEFYIHKMSEHMDSAEIIQWLVAEGQSVAAHQAIIEVMTDKFAVELEAPQAGILAGIRPGCVKGAVVPVGEPIAYIAQPGERVPALPPFGDNAAEQAATAAPQQAADGEAAAGEVIGRRVKSTVARRMAKDLGVDIEQVHGTGPGGRIVEADIRTFAELRKPPAASPAPDPSPAAPTPATVPMSTPAGDNGFRYQNSRRSSALRGSGCAKVW